MAIGFSEGGLAPLLTFFDAVPHDNATYVLLRHLPMHSRSELQHILKAHSKLEVVEVAEEMEIEKDTIYMPPPSMYLSIKRNKFFLHPRLQHPSPTNQIIDFFLSSLSRRKSRLSIAIILSGRGNDGTRGIKLLKAAGGMTIVQNIDSCEVKDMPLNALNSGAADIELLPVEMPTVVLRHIAGVLKSTNIIDRIKEEMDEPQA